jgi:hypothetical protein
MNPKHTGLSPPHALTSPTSWEQAPFLKNSILHIYYQFKIITMFYQLKNALVAAMLLPLALGCKREALMDKNTNAVVNDVAVHKVQQWLKAQPSQQVKARKAGTALPNLTLQWGAAEFDAATHTHWVPAVPANKEKAGGKPNTYLVATENEQGQITGGQYIMVLPNAKKMGANTTKGLPAGQAGFNPAVLAAQPNAPMANFSGAVLYYDAQGLFTGSQVYEAGQVQPKATANLAARDLGQGSPSPNKVIRECGEALGIPVCIDWYWQTYVNGVLVDEDYMFTTCCSGTSGGGSGVNNNAECQAQLDAMVAAGEVVTNSPITETTETQTNTEWTKRYSWVIFKAVSWGLVSYERAVLQKVYYPSNNQSLWEYKTFDHVSIGEFGMAAMGTYSHADLGATINKTKYSAYVQVDFSVTSKTCGGVIGITNVYNANKRFVAPNQIQYVNRQAT